MAFDIVAIRQDFPLFDDDKIAYLDSAASSQKPRQVIDGMRDIMAYEYANIHRGTYRLSENLSTKYENVRGKIATFLNAPSQNNIVFSYNSTSAINMVAHSLMRGRFIQKNDVILISQMEHHANIVPWQLICDDIGAKIIPIPLDDNGDINMVIYADLLSQYKPRLVAMTHISNVLGAINPIKEITKLAHDVGAFILIDGSQAVAHIPIDVSDIGCDFYVFTGHKIYGPTGVGVLYAAGDWLDRLPPFLGGGDMIESVDFIGTTYNTGPAKFEAGTPPIIETIGLDLAIDYYKAKASHEAHSHEMALYDDTKENLQKFNGLRILGNPSRQAPILTFTWDGYHPHDVASILDANHVATRVGLHCAEPLMKSLNISSAIRISFGIYNHKKDIDQLMVGLEKAQKMLKD